MYCQTSLQWYGRYFHFLFFILSYNRQYIGMYQGETGYSVFTFGRVIVNDIYSETPLIRAVPFSLILYKLLLNANYC